MAVKILNVESLRTERHPVPLADKIQAAVDGFLGSKEGGELDKLEIVPNPNNTGPYGQATVAVYFTPNPGLTKKEKGGK